MTEKQRMAHIRSIFPDFGKKPKKENLSTELKIIYKMLDSVSWEILEKYLKLRRDKEFIIDRDRRLKLKKEAAKDIMEFIDSTPGLKDDLLKLSPIPTLPEIGLTGMTPPPAFKSLKELREATK